MKIKYGFVKVADYYLESPIHRSLIFYHVQPIELKSDPVSGVTYIGGFSEMFEEIDPLTTNEAPLYEAIIEADDNGTCRLVGMNEIGPDFFTKRTLTRYLSMARFRPSIQSEDGECQT